MPEKVGLVEVFVDEPKFTGDELRRVSTETAQYFPKGLLEFVLINPILLKKDDVYQHDVATILKNIRIKVGVDKIVGLSRKIHYLESPEGAIFHGHAFPDKMVTVCNEIRIQNGLPLNLAHDLGHLYGLGHCNYKWFLSRLESYYERTDDFTKIFLMGIPDYIEEFGIRTVCGAIRKLNKEKLKPIYAGCPERDYIMCAGSDATKNSFSPKNFSHLESLVE